METEFKGKVKSICDKVYQKQFKQITIDLIQDNIEELLENDDRTPEEIGAACYNVGLLVEVFNPVLDHDLELLKELKEALHNWYVDAERVNKFLGLDPNK